MMYCPRSIAAPREIITTSEQIIYIRWARLCEQKAAEHGGLLSKMTTSSIFFYLKLINKSKHLWLPTKLHGCCEISPLASCIIGIRVVYAIYSCDATVHCLHTASAQAQHGHPR
jgi:hypothetical protein